MFSYKPTGVCAREINFEVVDNKISSVAFIGGCPGNAIGLSTLLIGMDVNAAIKQLKGIGCGNNTTSCPDQLAIALEKLVVNA